jgi:hypothetical protein
MASKTPIPVSEFAGFDQSRLELAMQDHQPIVFRGAADAWPLVKYSKRSIKTLLDKLRDLVGHNLVDAKVGLPGDNGLISGAGFVGAKNLPNAFHARRPFSGILNEIERESSNPTGHYVYMFSVKVAEQLPELLPFLELPKINHQTFNGDWRLWLGSGDHSAQIHADGEENLFFAIAGQKTFTVYPPQALPDLYVCALEGGAYSAQSSTVNPQDPDLTRFPKFTNAQKIAREVTLKPGDMMYLPSRWWHSVDSVGLNLGINYWWSDVPDTAVADSTRVFANALLYTRTMPDHWRAYWKVLFDQFVFLENGEPFPHLPPHQQGYAGDPDPARRTEILNVLAGLRARSSSINVADMDVAAATFKISTDIRIRIDNDGKFEIENKTDQSVFRMPDHLIHVLKHFGKPNQINGLRETLANQGRRISDDKVDRIVRDMVQNGILVTVFDQNGDSELDQA